MTQPLALVLYEKLLPGSQLVNRLQDLGYRIETLTNPETLVESCQQIKPLLVVADIQNTGDVCAAIQKLRKNAGTEHIPVIAICPENPPDRQAAAHSAGATLVVSEAAILNHLSNCLEQALRVD